MSDLAQRPIQFSEIADLIPKGGEYLEENRYGRDPDAEFVPWGRNSFKPAPTVQPPAPAQETPAEQEAASEDAKAEADDAAPTAEADAQQGAPEAPQAGATATAAAPAPARPAPPPKAPPPPEPEGPSAEEIVAAIEQAREDGRNLGYQQGVEATRREISATLSTLRKLEAQITALAADAVERNADIMAHHVRRIAQDLFGAVFAEMPEVFVERIKTAAEMFTKAGADFTLAMNPHDMLSLQELMQENEIFEKIRIIEDDSLQSGSFHLSSRDLDYEDAPVLTDIRGS